MRLIDADKLPLDIEHEDIDDAPTIDAVEVVHGEWIKYEDGTTVCSNCGFTLEDWIQGVFYNFCPNCGAKMDGEEFEEPTINPCRGCEDYDGYGGCKSNGGCGRTEMDG